MVLEKPKQLYVIFQDDEEKQMLENWKRLMMQKKGFGGIKQRIIEVIKEDLNGQ